MKKMMVLACVLLTFAAAPAIAQDAQVRLWEAAISGDSAVAAQSIADGANVDSMDTRTSVNGRRALNWAAYHGNVAVIRVLLAHKASVNLTNRTGFTPLHHAGEMGRRDAAAILMAAGADRTLRNANGLTAAEVAEAQGHSDVAVFIAKP